MRKTRTKSVYRAGVGIRHGACTREEGADKPACTRLLPFVSAAFDTISAAHAGRRGGGLVQLRYTVANTDTTRYPVGSGAMRVRNDGV